MSDDKVGYRNPPKHSRFKPGNNANPNGRPRKKALSNTDDILREVLSETITVKVHGKERKMSMREAVVRTFVNKGASGSARDAKRVLDHAPTATSQEQVNGSREDADFIFNKLVKMREIHEESTFPREREEVRIISEYPELLARLLALWEQAGPHAPPTRLLLQFKMAHGERDGRSEAEKLATR